MRSVAGWSRRPLRWPVLQGVLPLRRAGIPGDLLAGVTLAALGIPEVLGYARIAGMPVVTGLYTLLLPMALFAVLGASRHLVVAADSATAAILAGALVRLADPGSAEYVRLAGLAALLTGALLILARLARLGFLASFLSRTVLLGFLAGVGIQVAIGQLPDMLGVSAPSTHTVIKLAQTVAALPQAQGITVAVSLGVIVIVLAARRITRRIPGALIAVAGAIIVSRAADLAAHGVSVTGYIPRGLPGLRAASPGACTTRSRCWAPRPRSHRDTGPERRHRPRLRGQVRRAVQHGHRPDRAGGRQRRRRVHGHVRGERGTLHQDPDRGRRGRAQPAGLTHHQRAGRGRPVWPPPGRSVTCRPPRWPPWCS